MIFPFPFLDAESLKNNIKRANTLSTKFLETSYNKLIIVAQGGSILPLRAITRYLQIDHAKLIFFDTLLPMDTDPKIYENSLCLCISRSGETLEVINQYKKLQQFPIKTFVILTNVQRSNTLHTMAKKRNDSIVPLNADTIGRYSFVSLSTLFPLRLLNISLDSFVDALEDFNKNFYEKNYISMAKKKKEYFHKGKNIQVFLGTSNQLIYTLHWFAQLYGESLGKNGYFMTPLVSIWPQDLHSIFQLMIDGPKDKIFDVFSLINKDTNDTVKIESHAYKQALTMIQNAGHPIHIFPINNFHDYIKMLFHLATETIYLADTLHINPYSQPVIDKRKALLKE